VTIALVAFCFGLELGASLSAAHRQGALSFAIGVDTATIVACIVNILWRLR